jgi:anti-sigma regulatory factor (Ser/Thr protein kinase)
MSNADGARTTPTVAGGMTPDQAPGIAAAHLDEAGRRTANMPAVPLDQPFDEDALYILRSAVAAHAAELGAGPALADTVLVAHELCSNAVRHGGGAGRLRMWRADERLYCQVSDAGPGLVEPERAGAYRPSPTVPGGRGLWIARQLSVLEIETGPSGTTITAALPIPGA